MKKSIFGIHDIYIRKLMSTKSSQIQSIAHIIPAKVGNYKWSLSVKFTSLRIPKLYILSARSLEMTQFSETNSLGGLKISMNFHNF